ncbi:type II toxin-antitoxin system HipA family toxin [Hujiaoplasma nucleasis]|uniref:Type II toxin-antitoxin system HipA family toxin n=2 Tax=Hujiaoplasma nucleasis TaxID=2725268 RepID=A0A7L6N6U5_9MOLU|nr:type II toxin-antitoxin system HipA family toxin [Hujiaoplasma nucleasis]
MMTVAEVRLWGKRIAAVSIDEDSPYVYFKYDDEFVHSGINLSPIMMPLSREIYQFKTLHLNAFKGLPGLLSDSLPDRYGDQIINAWLKSQDRSIDSFNIIERLCYVGKRGMGALEYYPSKYNGFNEVEDIELDNLVKLSNEILNAKENVIAKREDELEEIIKVGTSAGGARAKAIIAYNEKTGVIKSGQIDAGSGFSYWLLKLDGVDQKEESSFTRREYAYYLMAIDAKIIMTESRLIEKDGYYHFMTKRFDRFVNSNGDMEKLHMQTLGALAHVDYNQPGIMSYERVTDIMYIMGIKLSENKQFFRRMVFNVMSRNQDDHVKNISFLMNKNGEWALSPAYDITYSFNPEGKWTSRHQMTINSKDHDFTMDDMLKSAEKMKIKPEEAKTIINDVRKSLLKWDKFADQAFLNIKEKEFIKNQFILFNTQ